MVDVKALKIKKINDFNGFIKATVRNTVQFKIDRDPEVSHPLWWIKWGSAYHRHWMMDDTCPIPRPKSSVDSFCFSVIALRLTSFTTCMARNNFSVW